MEHLHEGVKKLLRRISEYCSIEVKKTGSISKKNIKCIPISHHYPKICKPCLEELQKELSKIPKNTISVIP